MIKKIIFARHYTQNSPKALFTEEFKRRKQKRHHFHTELMTCQEDEVNVLLGGKKAQFTINRAM